MLPIRNIPYLLPMCCSFWEKCISSQKTGQGCSTPLRGTAPQNEVHDPKLLTLFWKIIQASSSILTEKLKNVIKIFVKPMGS